MKKKIMFIMGALLLPVALVSLNNNDCDLAIHRNKYYGEYTDRDNYIKYGEKLNGRMADEGFVLLKNDGFLPMAKGLKLSVVGKSSTNLSRGGAGSGSGSISRGVTGIDLQQSLVDAGFVINDALTEFYNDKALSGDGRKNGNTNWRGISQVEIGETPMNSYSSELIDSLDDYNDAIIQVITREGSEGCDVKMVDARDNNTDYPLTSKHALELTDNEQALFDEAKKHTDHIIIVINSSNIFECDNFMKDPKVSGVLWIGNPGDVGPGAVGRILCGDVNPSGRTVDTWARDFTKDPTYQNFSDNQQHNPAINPTELQGYAPIDTMLNPDGTPMRSYGTYKAYTDYNNIPYGADYELTHIPQQFSIDNKIMPGGVNGVKPAAYISYEEGVYLDYRYYETVYADMLSTSKKEADAWYNGEEGVVYPFGYGLSYTTFDQEIVWTNKKKGSTLTEKDEIIELSVKVTNTGKVSGKDVVQAYWKAPYIKGGIEKADHVLCAFGKTKTIEPGKSEIVNLKFHLQDVANYDAFDKNNNQFKGYELDGGKYSVMIGKNAHEMYEEVTYKIGEKGIQYRYDRFTGEEVVNRFTDRGFHNVLPGENDIEFTQMSRSNFKATFPTHPTEEDRKVKNGSRYEQFLTTPFHISDLDTDKNFTTIPEEAYKTKEDAEKGKWQQQNTVLKAYERTQLSEMKGVELGDPKWEEFINEFTWNEMMLVLEKNAMRSPAINEIGKPSFSEGDGPQKFNIIWWVSSPIVAATWNQELAYEQGEAIGMEAHIQNKSGWWGPGLNTHRSPFGGRNFEYYSADPFLMGKMAAQVIEAASDAGIYVYLKHFAVNDQEKNRETGISFLSEQTLREIYLKSFQIVFEEAKPMGVMASYNRIGLIETAGSYPLLTEVLRGEWGFKGSVLSDMTHSNNAYIDFGHYENVTQRIIAGCNAQLDQNGGFEGRTQTKWDATANNGKGAPVYEENGKKVISYTFWYAARKCMIEHLYMSANCVAMNRGITTSVANPTMDAKVSEYAYYDVETLSQLKVGTKVTVEGKEYTIQGIDSFDMDNRQGLPKGIGYTDGAIYGDFQETGLYRFHFVAHLTVSSAGEDSEQDLDVAIKLTVNVSPVMDKPSNHLSVGAIVGISAGAAIVIAAAVILFVLRKKKVAEKKN